MVEAGIAVLRGEKAVKEERGRANTGHHHCHPSLTLHRPPPPLSPSLFTIITTPSFVLTLHHPDPPPPLPPLSFALIAATMTKLDIAYLCSLASTFSTFLVPNISFPSSLLSTSSYVSHHNDSNITRVLAFISKFIIISSIG